MGGREDKVAGTRNTRLGGSIPPWASPLFQKENIMGWWGTDVMAGDTPLDQLGMIADTMDLEYQHSVSSRVSYLSSYKLTKEVVEENLPKVMDSIAKIRDKDDRFISYQVFGVVIMEVGAEMRQDVKNQIAEAAALDIWAAGGDEERIAHMRSYLKMLETYDGTPTPYEGKTLFR